MREIVFIEHSSGWLHLEPVAAARRQLIQKAHTKALLPEGEAVALRDKGITELPLARLNAWLGLQGYVIYASKGRDAKRRVACQDMGGRVERYGLFKLERIFPGSQD